MTQEYPFALAGSHFLALATGMRTTNLSSCAPSSTRALILPLQLNEHSIDYFGHEIVKLYTNINSSTDCPSLRVANTSKYRPLWSRIWNSIEVAPIPISYDIGYIISFIGKIMFVLQLDKYCWFYCPAVNPQCIIIIEAAHSDVEIES